MKLYLLRHADAAARNPNLYPEDSLRPLTKKGHKELERVAKYFSSKRLVVDAIFTSPFLRALETANVMCKALELKKGRLMVTSHLAPLGDVGELVSEINAKLPLENFLLVGHEPDLSGLISLLLTGDHSLLTCRMKKASLCCVSMDELVAGKCACLEWLWHPDL